MGAKPRTIKAKVSRRERERGGRAGVSFRGNSVDSVSIGCEKLLLTAKVGGERGQSAAQKQTNTSSSKTVTAAESGAKPHKQRPRNSEHCPAEGVPRRSPKGGVPKGGAPDCWAPKGGVPKNFVLFFSLACHCFSFILPLSGGLLVEFWWFLKRQGPQMCTFGVFGLSCETKATPESRRGSKNTTEIPRKKPKREKKE